MSAEHRAALACFAGAAAWPSLMGWMSNLLMTPYQRAVREAFCGVPFHEATALLAHCAACWSGSAILIAAGLALMHAAAPARLVRQQQRITRPRQ